VPVVVTDMGNEQGKLQGVPTPAGIQSMDESLQKKFAKGIQYNSKSTLHWAIGVNKTTVNMTKAARVWCLVSLGLLDYCACHLIALLA
jgi:hypothetical protein